jgi:DNA gyrase subunit A
LVAIKDVTDQDDLMIINKSGIVIRIGVGDLRVMGRATQGVRLITLKEEDAIASIAKVDHEDEEEEIVNNTETSETNEENNVEGEEPTVE